MGGNVCIICDMFGYVWWLRRYECIIWLLSVWVYGIGLMMVGIGMLVLLVGWMVMV